MFEQIATQVGLALGIGAFTCVMAKLASAKKWDNRKLAYTLGLTFVTGLTAVNAIEGGIDETNIVKVFLEVLGLNFIAHTGINIAGRLQKNK